MDCAVATKALSDGDGRVPRRRDIRAHLRDCAECRPLPRRDRGSAAGLRRASRRCRRSPRRGCCRVSWRWGRRRRGRCRRRRGCGRRGQDARFLGSVEKRRRRPGYCRCRNRRGGARRLDRPWPSRPRRLATTARIAGAVTRRRGAGRRRNRPSAWLPSAELRWRRLGREWSTQHLIERSHPGRHGGGGRQGNGRFRSEHAAVGRQGKRRRTSSRQRAREAAPRRRGARSGNCRSSQKVRPRRLRGRARCARREARPSRTPRPLERRPEKGTSERFRRRRRPGPARRPCGRRSRGATRGWQEAGRYRPGIGPDGPDCLPFQSAKGARTGVTNTGGRR